MHAHPVGTLVAAREGTATVEVQEEPGIGANNRVTPHAAAKTAHRAERVVKTI